MCTNLLISVPTDASGTPMHVSARCLELSGTLPTSLYVVPRGLSFPQDDPPVAPGSAGWKRWTNRFGFVGIASPAGRTTYMDGLNEKGLSVGALWLPGTAYPSTGDQPSIYFADLGAFILGNFETVSELQASLGAIGVIGPAVPAASAPPGSSPYLPLHFIVTDALGQSLVIELVDGVMTVHASTDGVLTNAPTYGWQRTNLQSYVGLRLAGAQTSVASEGPPVGEGLLGMPGDPMSPSRFVRAFTLRQGFGLLPSDGQGWLPAPGGNGYADAEQTAVTVAMQLVQIVMATPYGTLLVAPASPGDPPTVGDWTMWSIVRDHTNRRLYFTTAFNGIMRRIDLDRLSFDPLPGQPTLRSLPLQPTSLPWFEDATASLT